MSVGGAAAVRKVLKDFCAFADQGGALRKAQAEAGTKLKRNHERVLNDLCNPSSELNIDGKPLTQRELIRADSSKRKQTKMI